MTGGEEEKVRRGEAEIDDVETLALDAVGERSLQIDSRRPHVASHQRAVARTFVFTSEAGERGSNAHAQLRVELIGHRTPHVVRLEYVLGSADGGPTLVGAHAATPCPS
jgi:hypothetical protein